MKINLRTTRQCNLETYSSCWRPSGMSTGYMQSFCWNIFGRADCRYNDYDVFSDFSRSWNLSRQEAKDFIRGFKYR